MPNIGPTELIIVLVIVLVLFGASRLPGLGRSMGQSVKGFKQGLNEGVKDEDEKKTAEDAPDATSADGTEKTPEGEAGNGGEADKS